MKKLLIAAAIILALTAPAASAQHQNSTNVQPSPGIVGPGSMFYGLETAADDFSISLGFTTAQAVANERASEALIAAEQNNTEASVQALNSLNQLSKNHNITDENGTSKAMNILGQVSKNIPEQAQQGIQTAMDNIRGNVPADIPAGSDNTRSDGIPADQGPAMRGPSDGNDTTGSENMPETNDTVPTDNTTTGDQKDDVPDTGDQTDTGSTTEQTSASTGQFYLMVSDRPADISDFGYLNVTFEQARIFEQGDSTSEENTTSTNETTNSTETNSTETNKTDTNSTGTNVTENETTEGENEGYRTVDLNGTADLTQVVGDKAKSIANLNLEEGNYTKISLYAESIDASVNGSEVNVKIPPGKLMITKPFTVSANSTTGFVFDIGVFLRGNQQNNQGYILKPVISESGVAGKDVPVNLTDKGGNIPDFAGNTGRPENTTSGGQPEDTTSGGQPENTTSGQQQGPPENQSTGRP